MTMKSKQELIEQVVALLRAMIEVDETPPITFIENNPQTIEMLTVKECTETIKCLL